MWTPEFSRFVAPARAKPQVWRLIVGMLAIALAYVLAFFILLIGLVATLGFDDGMAYLALIETGGTPTLIVALLAMFAGPFLAAVLVVGLLHRRPAATLFGPGTLHGFGLGVATALLVYTVAWVALPEPFVPVANLPLNLWLSFLPAALVALAIQTGAEEVVFRGYMQQQLAARFQSPWIWMVVPALSFGMLHGDPTGGPEHLWMILPPTLFGLLAADLTRVTGTIGAAWGLHFANNCSAILFTALAGNLSGLALYRTPFGSEALSIDNPLIWQEMLVTIILWACLRLWVARGASRIA
ncbi:MAG: type II CAAX endopeptidase family protein [Jannaschia sp.]